MATLVSQEAVIYMQKYKASQQLPGHPSGRHWTRRAVSIGVYVFLIAGSPLSKAQVQAAPKRLSDWLLEQPYKHDAYYLGLSWRVTDEVPTQYALRQELLQTLTSTSRDITASTKAVNRLRAWIASLPVTGRVPIANADVRWLQANPVRDPILLAGHSVVLPRRPTTVTVITGNGTRCAANHAAGYEVRAYLNACGVTNADWAWIAQPDGRIQRFGVATWNRVNGYRNPPKSGGKDGLRFLVWRALLRGAEMELLNRHADVRGKKD